MAVELSIAHRRRLRDIWRSAGWPCQDMLEVARPAPKRPLQLSFGLWMALARAGPVDNGPDEDAQGWLGGAAGAAPDASTT